MEISLSPTLGRAVSAVERPSVSGQDDTVSSPQGDQSRKGIRTVDSAASVSLRLSGGYSRGSSNGVLNICKPSEMTNIGTVH